ncbi:MAG: TonB C-terminal domain-containing protein [Myxococcota bacterium]
MEELSHRTTLSTRGPSALLVAGSVIASLVFHAALAGLMVWGTMLSEEDMEEDAAPETLKFENVELLALGEEKPPEQLPRLANPAPPEVDEDAVNLAAEQKPEPEKEKEEEKKDKDREDREKRMADALSQLNNPNRPSNTDTPEGREEGVAGGTATDPELASKMQTWQAKLKAALVQHWEVPTTLTDAEVEQLAGKVNVRVKISSTGRILNFRFLEKSGNEQFDASINAVLEKFSATGGGKQLPMPNDPGVTRQLVQQPLLLQQWDALARQQ